METSRKDTIEKLYDLTGG